MLLQFYINENGDKVYTTKKESPVGLATKSAHPGMARNWGFLVVAFFALASICESAIFHPVSESHRSAALELFSPPDGSFSSLDEKYEALKTFEVLGIEKTADIRTSTCAYVLETLQSTTSDLKEIFHALRSNNILKCDLKIESFGGIQSRLEDSLNGANTLFDYYYTIGGLVLLKDQIPQVDLQIGDADRILRSIKALSQSDGKWRHSSSNTESSIDAAGIALETVAGVISLAASEIDHSLIASLKTDVVKLFDGVKRYDDGTYYFEEKLVDARGEQGPLSTTASVVRGITAFAAVTPESLNLPGEKILGLARFFLGIGIPGSAKDLFYQTDALSCLDNIRGSIPLILSLPATVISVTMKDQVKVKVTTVLGSSPPNLSVKLVQIFPSGSKDGSIINQNLKYDPENEVYILEALPTGVDIGNYIFSFEIIFDNPDQKRNYATGGRTKVPIYITGVVEIKNAEIAIIDNDIGSIETQKKLNLAEENAVTLSANHLQKLRLSFDLSTPSENAFKPQQVFLKLTHRIGVDHIFVVGNSGKNFVTVLDFLGLVEKFFYLSGRYDIQLTVGDSVMENSFLQPLGYIELDLPDAPEKAPHPPPQPVDPYSRYGPKAEISHIFRAPEKRPPRWLSITFLVLVCIPFVGFLASAIFYLRANLKNFPKASSPAVFALLFHLGIAAVLLLYVAFWFKLDLFTTLKALGFLGAFLMFVGHRTLSHLASSTSASAKLKSS